MEPAALWHLIEVFNIEAHRRDGRILILGSPIHRNDLEADPWRPQSALLQGDGLSALRILQDYRFLATRPRKAQFPGAPVLPESFIGSLVAVLNNNLRK